MQVPSFSTVHLSSLVYVGGALAPYATNPILLGNLRAIGSIEHQSDVAYSKGWGSYTEQPYKIQGTPKEISFLINTNRQDWLTGLPLPQAWSSKNQRVCFITIKQSQADPGARIQFVCQPHNWAVNLSTSDVLLIDCSVLALTPINPEFLPVT
jgi:hypothetical protein